MEKKSALPFAAVLALAAAWTMLTQRGSSEKSPFPGFPAEKSTITKQTVQASKSKSEQKTECVTEEQQNTPHAEAKEEPTRKIPPQNDADAQELTPPCSSLRINE